MHIRRWFMAVFAAMALLASPGFVVPAYAAPSVHVHAFGLALDSWPTFLAGVVGFCSSQLTAIFTHHRAPQWVKSLTNLLLTTLGGVLVTMQTVAGYTWKDYVGVIGAAWFASLATHFSGLTALAQAATADFGIGGNTPPIVARSGTTVTYPAGTDAPAAADVGAGADGTAATGTY